MRNEKTIEADKTSKKEQLSEKTLFEEKELEINEKIERLKQPVDSLRRPIVIYLGCGCKGGIGKTTVCVNVANTIKKLFPNKKTLLIDFDQQANASTLSNIKTENPEEKYNDIGTYAYQAVTTNRAYLKEDVKKLIYTPHYQKKIQKKNSMKWETIEENYNFDIIPSSIALSLLEMLLFKSKLQLSDEKKETILPKIVNVIKNHFDYDFIIIDGSPAMGIFMTNCLNSADYVITPTTLVFTSLIGISYVIELINNMKENTKLNAKWLGIIINNAKNRGAEKLNKDELFNRFGTEAVFKNEISSTADNENATMSEQILSNYNKKAEQQFKAITLELLERIVIAEGRYK